MPTFTTIALESLLEPKIRDSYKASARSASDFSTNENTKNEEKKKPPTRRRVSISPALYITPDPTPVVESSLDSLTASPYVVNRKGRGGMVVNRRIDGFEVENERKKSELQVEETVDDNFLGVEDFVAADDFLDTRRESLSVGSSGEVNDLGIRVESPSLVSNQGEFFDADDEFSSDGSISNAFKFGHDFESEMRSTRLSLLEEIEKRKTAEDALGLLYNQWLRIGNLLSAQTGLKFPSPPTANSMQLGINSIEQFCQEVVVTRFVSEAIGKGIARAEAELAAEAIVKTKDQEISRLRDRLQYYEAVNHEMCQRNQEVIEVARRQRQKKKGLQRWIWGGIALSIAIGASVIAYSFLPQTSASANEPLMTSIDSSDASSIS